MIYQYHCSRCKEFYTIQQGVMDEHIYECPQCHKWTNRIFTAPVVKKNEGFFSVQLGRIVKSHNDFEEGMERLEFMHDLKTDNNRTPKDEWVEKKVERQQRNEEMVKETDEQIAEQNKKNGWYEDIETFQFEPEKYE